MRVMRSLIRVSGKAVQLKLMLDVRCAVLPKIWYFITLNTTLLAVY
jgi:hypothetical protein